MLLLLLGILTEEEAVQNHQEEFETWGLEVLLFLTSC